MAWPLVRAAGLAAAAIAATWLVYGATIAYGFHYDDYHFVRPYTSAEVLATFSGPWDAAGIERRFYRPLTIAFYALRFELFGLNAAAYHAASLIMFAFAATLAGLLAGRIAGTWTASVFAVAAFVAHPAMAYAQAVWITNQMHLLASVTVLCALLWWFRVAERSLTWWLPLILLGAGAFLLKEDGIMLLPVILVLHALRRRVLHPGLRPAPRAFVALAALATIALVAMRHWMLGGIGGYGQPTVEAAVVNFAKGLIRVFALMPSQPPWLPPASWFAILLPVAAMARWRRTSPGARFLFLAGAVIGIMFDVPFVLVTKKEQLHLVALGSSFLLAGSALALIEAARHRALRAAAIILVAAGLGTCASVAHKASTDFEPFGPMVLAADETVRGWTAVPIEIRDYLRRKGAPGAAGRLPVNPAHHLALVAYGLEPAEYSADGSSQRRAAQSRADLLVTSAARTITIQMRGAGGTSVVRVRIDRRATDAVFLEGGSWQTSSYDVRPADAGFLARMHRIVIHGSGLQIGEIVVR